MDNIVTLFQYLFMDHIKTREIKKQLDICYPTRTPLLIELQPTILTIIQCIPMMMKNMVYHHGT